jgi:hypothetical protein
MRTNDVAAPEIAGTAFRRLSRLAAVVSRLAC